MIQSHTWDTICEDTICEDMICEDTIFVITKSLQFQVPLMEEITIQ